MQRQLCQAAFLLALALAPALAASAPPTEGLDGADLSFWQLRPIGPAVAGGRITALAVSPADNRFFYVATASGNLWKTSNFGTTFQPLLEDAASASIGAVAVAPSDPQVVWVGTGEANNRQSSSWGSGLYRSIDGGEQWVHLGLEETRHIGRIAVHPAQPDTAYVAALGHLWGPNPERGVYRTRDGGRSWERVLYRDEDSGAVDLVMDPQDPLILYAALYQRRRTAFGFNGGGPGSGIYRTLDGGDSWEELTNGLPQGDKGRIGLAVHLRDPLRLYATVEAAEEGGVFRSLDRGESWQRVNSLNPRPMYFSKIRIDPNNPERVFVLGQHLHLSENAGRTFSDRAAQGVHPDHHDLWIDPGDSNRMILGGDGGLSISFDGGRQWRMIDNLPIAQVYKLGVDMQSPYYVYAGLQDNGTWAGPSQVRDRRGIRNADWINVHSGDGFYAAIDPEDHTVVYAQSQRGRIVRVDMKSGERQRIQPIPEHGGAYRWNWSSPLILSRHNPGTLYAAANLVLKSSDRGLSWKPISADLTSRIDRSQLDIMQAPEARMLSRHDGVASYGTITALAESPLDPLVLYAGSDDGKLQATRDAGLSWADLSPRIGAPSGALVSSLAASSRRAGRVYVAFDNHRNDDYRPYAFASDDFGHSWRSIRSGLPESPINVLIEHPADPDLLFAGSETGLFVSVDRGGRWQPLGGNFPTVAVDDLLIHPRSNDLVVGTHGRGIWILDDITPLQEWGKLRLDDPFHLFSVRQAVAFNPRRPQAWNGQAEFAADNPTAGARIRYRVAKEGQLIELDVLESQGRHVRRLAASSDPGLHETIWDLRLPVLVSPEPVAGEHWPRGPRLMPGRYSVRLRSQGHTQQREFFVSTDPEVEASLQDLRLRQDLLLDLYSLQAPLRAAQRAAVQAADAASAGRSGAQPQRLEASQISRSATQARRDLRRYDRSARVLFDAIEGATTRPTSDQVRLTRQLFEEVTSQLERLNTLLAHRLPDLYQELDGARLPSSLPSPIPLPGRASKEQQR